VHYRIFVIINHYQNHIPLMKKSLLTLLVCFTTSAVMASSTPVQDIFADDLGLVDQEFAALNAVEDFVATHQVTNGELALANQSFASTLKSDHDLGASILGSNAPEERLLDIPGFWWGCCLGLIGAVLVYVAIEDPVAKKREGKQAIIGWAVNLAVGAILYVVYIFAVFGSFAAFSAG
jgi:hypothetical protein